MAAASGVKLSHPSAGVLEVTNGPPVYTSLDQMPARFGKFGGRYIPETLAEAHDQLAAEYIKASQDPEFRLELEKLGRDYIGRPTPMYFAERLTKQVGGAQIWFKREELAHTGAHKINNALGQALLAKKLGKKRVIAETGAGQHGVATATACALLGLDCTVYMGEEDMRRQALNVFRMQVLGAKCKGVSSGSKTLKDAVNEALRDWVTNVRTTHYIIGSAIGPHPFPTIVRDFQSVIGRESRVQMLERCKRLPDYVVACVGGGSNAIGMFHGFLDDAEVKLVGVEAGGHGVPESAGKGGDAGDGLVVTESGAKRAVHSATLVGGTPGVLHGTMTYLLQDSEGQITETHSVSAGLDYPGVGPEHAFLKDSGRVEYVAVTDSEALEALQQVSRAEGMIPALEPAHALFHGMRLAKSLPKDQIVLINFCGRGDKDMEQVAKLLRVDLGDRAGVAHRGEEAGGVAGEEGTGGAAAAAASSAST